MLFASVVMQMSSRVDALEASIQDIINSGDGAASSGRARRIDKHWSTLGCDPEIGSLYDGIEGER